MPVKTLIKYTSSFVVVVWLAVLGGCSASGGGNETPPGGNPSPQPAFIDLRAAPDTVDVQESAALQATILDKDDRPVEGVTVQFALVTNISRATLSANSAKTNSSGQANLTYTAGTGRGTDRIEVRVGALSASVAIVVQDPSPEPTLTLVARPATVTPEGTAALEATVLDAAGDPLQGVRVNFRVLVDESGATLSASSAVTDANGQARVTYTAGAAEGTDTIEATGNGLIDTASITVGPPPVPTSLTLQATPSTVPVGGRARLDATVRDQASQPVADWLVNFTLTTNTSGAGLSAKSAVTGANGRASVDYTAGTVEGTDTIEARAKDITDPATTSITVTPPIPPPPASIELLVSSPQLDSGGTDSVTLTALVRDKNNNFLPDIQVEFAADANAGIQVLDDGITDAGGVAKALLSTAGDPENRDIPLRATIPQTIPLLSSTNTVRVTGTTISLSGPTALVLGESGTFSLLLQDSESVGIGNETVSLRSVAGNTIPATVVTGTNGDQTFQLTATVAGADTIQASALGATGSFDFTVSGDHFILTVANATQDIDLNVPRDVTVHWDRSGVNQANKPITFFITRGELCDPLPPVNCPGASLTKNTNSAGNVVVTIQSANAGPAVITAQTGITGGPSAQVSVEFVATNPAALILQAAPTSIGVNPPPNTDQQSIITATVRDAAGNLVKGKTISFSILEDETNGGIFPTASVTNSSGQASTVYTAGATPSAQDGVKIEACVSDDPVPPAPCATVSDTVAQQPLSVVLGTSNRIIPLGNTDYAKPYSVRVTDANGNPQENATVELNILSTRYQKGFYCPGGSPCGWFKFVTRTCDQEDVNRNGRLDPGEDTNNNGTLEPGNVSTVPGIVTTDARGRAEFNVEYAREFTWVEVQLEARATVVGSEGSSTAQFFLPGAAGDFNDCTVSPPGLISRFGKATSCACDELVNTQCPIETACP